MTHLKGNTQSKPLRAVHPVYWQMALVSSLVMTPIQPVWTSWGGEELEPETHMVILANCDGYLGF